MISKKFSTILSFHQSNYSLRLKKLLEISITLYSQNGKAPVTVKYAQRSNLIPVSQNQKNNTDKDDKDGMFDQTTGSIDAIEIDSHEYDIKSF